MIKVIQANPNSVFKVDDLVRIVNYKGDESIVYLDEVAVNKDGHTILSYVECRKRKELNLHEAFKKESNILSIKIIDTSNITTPKVVTDYAALLSADKRYVKAAKNVLRRYKQEFVQEWLDGQGAHQWCIDAFMKTDRDFYVNNEWDLFFEFHGETLEDASKSLFEWLDNSQYSGSQSRYYQEDIIPEIKKSISAGKDYRAGGNWDLEFEIRQPEKDVPEVITADNFAFFIEGIDITSA